ncbi:MAG: hypothetical protein KDA78_08440 [Planctomycetaceae bacterium]|nr:hypothetical protein [Planctomycetaceae bacterium]
MAMLFPFCKSCDTKSEHKLEDGQHYYVCPKCQVRDSKESVEASNMHILTGAPKGPDADQSPFELREF